MITPLLLCGGSGTRLWPLSRRSYPKQFASILSEESLFQASARRVDAPGYAPPLVITAVEFRFIATQQLAEAGIDPGAVLLEPVPRNTAPAILAGLLHLSLKDPEGLVLILPSDHVIPDAEAFRAAVEQGRAAAEAGRIVTFGITPDRPETGYGYLELAGDPSGFGAIPLSRFVEKPKSAEAYAGDPRFLWNAGIFLARADCLLDAFRSFAPDILPPVQAALAQAMPDLGFLRLAPEPWEQAPDISIDYAVMERANTLSVVPFSAGWSDLGGWNAVWSEMGPDQDGNAVHGAVLKRDCSGSLLRAETEGQAVIGLGLSEMMVVAMPDAVLVAPRDRAQEVGAAVAALKEAGIGQSTDLPRAHRPWGWFEPLVQGTGFQAKRIHVNPGAALSLQSHVHRAEHWIVVAGRARVTRDGVVRDMVRNQSIYIAPGAQHRLENPGPDPVVLIEVQTGDYLGEDDIIRYEDLYARKGEGKA